jgi:hypothetical protein
MNLVHIFVQIFQIFWFYSTFSKFRGEANDEKHADPGKKNPYSWKSRENSRNLLEAFLRSRKEENLYGGIVGSTLFEKASFWKEFRSEFRSEFHSGVRGLDLSLLTFFYLQKENRCAMAISEKKRVSPAGKIGIWHCAAVLFSQVPKKCTDAVLRVLQRVAACWN